MIETILNIICEHYQVSKADLGQKETYRQAVKLVEAKQVAVWLLWRYTKLHRMEIAALLGYCDKQNVNASRRRIKVIAEGNHAFKKELETIEEKILRH